VARLLIVGGGCRGRRLAADLVAEGHSVRITTRTCAARTAIERTGAECWIGTPDRLATLRGALDGVTIACWLLATARGSREQLNALHTSRLRFFLGQLIDTPVRGFVYEASARIVAPDGDETSARMAGSDGDEASARVAGSDADEASARMLAPNALIGGERIVRTLATQNAIPVAFVHSDPSEHDAWLSDGRRAVNSLLMRAR
jgi:hypothetical protein